MGGKYFVNFSPRREQCGDQGDSRGNSRLATSLSRRQVDCRSGADVQLHHPGLDYVLRSLLQVGTLSYAALSEPMPRALGDGEIQTPQATPAAGGAVDPGLPCGLRASLPTGRCCAASRLDDKSRISGDAHVRIRERLGVRIPWATRRLVHCRNEQEAHAIKAALQARLMECRLKMHSTKTKIVYCEDEKRKGKYPNIKFEFLGYCFRPRLVRKSRDNTLFCGFNRAVSPSALKCEDPGVGSPTSNRAVAGRRRRAAQSSPSGVDQLLWAIRAIGSSSLAPVRQSDATGLGDAEVQALSRPRATSLCKSCPGKARIFSSIGGLV